VTFDPVASFTGTSTNPVTYSVIDSLSQKSSSTITPSVTAPGAPVANPKTKIVSPTLAASFATITGQSGLATGTQLTPARTFLCSLSPAQSPPNCNSTSVTTTDGTWVLNQITGVVTYQPALGVSAGTKVAIRYQVTDAAGQSASALLTPVIPPAPIAKPDTSSGQQGTAQIISLTGNDVTGSASSSLDVSTVKFCAGNQVSPNCTATSLTVTGQGTYTIDSFGIVTFIPVSGFTGTATPISYQVSDTVGQVASSTLSVNVIPPPAPIAIRDTGSAAYGESVIFEPWKNDSGGSKPDGASQPAPDVVPTSIRLCSASQVAPNCTATSVGTVDGTYTLDTATGKVTFAPVSGFSGTATAPVTYQISNNWTGPSGIATTTAILIPTIAAPGAPVAENDKTSTEPDTPITLLPATNDSPGTAKLNAASLRLCDSVDVAPKCTRVTVTNAQGTYVVNPDSGAVTFTPVRGFRGVASLPYVVSDMDARVATANLFIEVSGVETTSAAVKTTPTTTTSTTAVTRTPANPQKATTRPKPDGTKMPKTGSSRLYALGEIAILTYLMGTGLVSANKWKRRNSNN
jgi:CshA-type fibril repeat protein